MSEEQIEQLIKYLGDLKFTGEHLQQSLREKIASKAPNFTIKHLVKYGEEQMTFQLNFKKDLQFNAYRLNDYMATLIKVPEITHSEINGINTALLEQSFKTIDWDAYYNDAKGKFTEEQRQEATALLSDLWQLTSRPSEGGGSIQSILQIKYWPQHVWDDAAKDLNVRYCEERSFNATEYGTCNADLAYNILSGRLDNLYDKLSTLELDQFPGIDLYRQLEKILSATPEEFYLEYKRNEHEAYMEFTIPVNLVNGSYHVDNYFAIVRPYPPIDHGVFNQVDTAKLESQMHQIDWFDEKNKFVMEKGEVIFPADVANVLEQIDQLLKEPSATDVTDRLMLKYWFDAEFYFTLIRQSAFELLNNLQQREHEFSIATNVKTAYNLLCGRPAIEVTKNNEPVDKLQWVRFDFNDPLDDDKYRLNKIPSFEEQPLEDIINLLPIKNMNYYPIRNGLLQGDIVTAQLNNGKTILIEANPEHSTVNLYEPDMRPIQANLRFDPDWKPLQQDAFKVEAIKQETQKKHNRLGQNNKYKRRRGKGM